MNKENEAIRLAVETLEMIVRRGYDSYHDVDKVSNAIVKLRPLLDQPAPRPEMQIRRRQFLRQLRRRPPRALSLLPLRQLRPERAEAKDRRNGDARLE